MIYSRALLRFLQNPFCLSVIFTYNCWHDARVETYIKKVKSSNIAVSTYLPIYRHSNMHFNTLHSVLPSSVLTWKCYNWKYHNHYQYQSCAHLFHSKHKISFKTFVIVSSIWYLNNFRRDRIIISYKLFRKSINTLLTFILPID